MRAIEIARRMAELGQLADAEQSYALALSAEPDSTAPDEQLEAAAWLLQSGFEDYKLYYDALLYAYQSGDPRTSANALALLDGAFLEPNRKDFSGRYERNCKLLERYPYLFRKDFPAFETLPVRFFPYDDDTYVPFDVTDASFSGKYAPRDSVIRHWFFRDLEKPVLAENIFSQYELEYLRDNVRKSEDIGRENHIYLHYTDWSQFCAYLQVLNLRPLLENQKFVFLIGDEIEQYPIDFKARFNLDYSRESPRPIGVRDICRLIWHTQLSAHNGGDFFNEVFDTHPNLLAGPSIILSSLQKVVADMREALNDAESLQQAQQSFSLENPQIVTELYAMRTSLSDKDLLVAYFLGKKEYAKWLDPASRIVPALFFQPHFYNIAYKPSVKNGEVTLSEPQVDKFVRSKMLRGFPYIKTFTPMRRFTNSYAATVRFMFRKAQKDQEREDRKPEDKFLVVSDAISERVLNRSFLRDPNDRPFHDSIIVRLEDGKLNATATFTALSAFLDLPYTESMRHCTADGKPTKLGFNPSNLSNTYDEFANDDERYFVEFLLRDAYAFYGYDFLYYDGKPVSGEKLKQLIANFTTLNHYIRLTWKNAFTVSGATPEQKDEIQQKLTEDKVAKFSRNRLWNAKALGGLPILRNRNRQPLEMTPLLPLDPTLLENPVYH